MIANAKLIGILILTVLAAVLLTLGVQHYKELRTKAALADMRQVTLETTSAVITDSTEADSDRSTTDAGVATARIIFEEGRRNDPSNASRAATPVPAGLRNAYRERRLARERLARDASGDAEGTRTEDVAER